MAYTKKRSETSASTDWRPWTAARFQTEGARDGFLRSVVDTLDSGWVAEALPGDGLGAQVRWLPGRFLSLNDVAYTHGGRIVVGMVRHSIF